MKAEACMMMGPVSMVTLHPFSAPLKAVLRHQLFISLGVLMEGRRGGGVVREQEGVGLNRFSG